MSKKIMFGSLVLLMVILVSGCGEKMMTEKMIENQLEKNLGGNANVDLSSGAVNIKGEDGSTMQVGGKVSLPEDFPSDVYVIDGELISAMKNVVGAGYQVTLKTDKKIEDIKIAYESKMKEGGWTIQQTINMGGILMMSGKKENRNLSVTVSAGTDDITGNVVTLTVMEAGN